MEEITFIACLIGGIFLLFLFIWKRGIICAVLRYLYYHIVDNLAKLWSHSHGSPQPKERTPLLAKKTCEVKEVCKKMTWKDFRETIWRIKNDDIRLNTYLLMVDLADLMSNNDLVIDFVFFMRSHVNLSDLTYVVLAHIIHALSQYCHNLCVADFVTQCFLSCTGAETLTSLKYEFERIDNLYDLIYVQLFTQKSCQQQIIAHIQSQQASQQSQSVCFMCDLDDTVYAVLYDKRYPMMTVYPGVKCFLQRCTQRYNNKIVFLTARPEFLRDSTTKLLQSLGFGNFTVLMGSMANLMGSQRMASRKLQNFKEHHTLFPEYKYVFLGDNGQGDIDLGKELALASNVVLIQIHDIIRPAVLSPSSWASLFSHKVVKQTTFSGVYRIEEMTDCCMKPFNNYIGAAINMYESNLFDIDDICNIVESTIYDFENIEFTTINQQLVTFQEIKNDFYKIKAQFEISKQKQFEDWFIDYENNKILKDYMIEEETLSSMSSDMEDSSRER